MNLWFNQLEKLIDQYKFIQTRSSIGMKPATKSARENAKRLLLLPVHMQTLPGVKMNRSQALNVSPPMVGWCYHGSYLRVVIRWKSGMKISLFQTSELSLQKAAILTIRLLSNGFVLFMKLQKTGFKKAGQGCFLWIIMVLTQPLNSSPFVKRNSLSLFTFYPYYAPLPAARC